jgi:GntR family transcriptional regulator
VPIERPTSEFRQVAAELRRRIQAGQYGPGSQLPTEGEIAEEIGVTRPTVNRAFSMLRSEGLIRPVRGRGTIVNPLPVITRQTIQRQGRQAREEGAARGAFAGELARLGLEARSDVDVVEALADEELSELLGVPVEAPLVARQRTMYANGVAVQLATSYLPLALAEGTTMMQPDSGPGGIYSRLADIGQAPATFREITRVRTPDSEEARLLDLDADHRVFDIIRVARTAEGRAVEVNVMVLPAHQWRLDTEWSAE